MYLFTLLTEDDVEITPFNRKFTFEPSRTLERVTTPVNQNPNPIPVVGYGIGLHYTAVTCNKNRGCRGCTYINERILRLYNLCALTFKCNVVVTLKKSQVKVDSQCPGLIVRAGLILILS